MRRNEARVKKAMELALERLDYIMDYHTAPDFVEVTGRMGEDVITYRIHKKLLCVAMQDKTYEKSKGVFNDDWEIIDLRE